MWSAKPAVLALREPLARLFWDSFYTVIHIPATSPFSPICGVGDVVGAVYRTNKTNKIMLLKRTSGFFSTFDAT